MLSVIVVTGEPATPKTNSMCGTEIAQTVPDNLTKFPCRETIGRMNFSQISDPISAAGKLILLFPDKQMPGIGPVRLT